jgi:hypothetical protein
MARTVKLKACVRGRLTGAIKLAVNLAGKQRVVKRAPPPSHLVREINWVVGGTLERIKVLKMDPEPARGVPAIGTTAWVLAKSPSPKMLELGCDRCAGPHRPRNPECSANLSRTTPMAAAGAMYDYQTGLKLDSEWTMVSESRMPRATVATRIYKRVR